MLSIKYNNFVIDTINDEMITKVGKTKRTSKCITTNRVFCAKIVDSLKVSQRAVTV